MQAKREKENVRHFGSNVKRFTIVFECFIVFLIILIGYYEYILFFVYLTKTAYGYFPKAEINKCCERILQIVFFLIFFIEC